jgi:hypothetical protein
MPPEKALARGLPRAYKTLTEGRFPPIRPPLPVRSVSSEVGTGSRQKTRQNKKLKAFFVPSVLGTKKALRTHVF